jgi:hypothetical protein
MTTSRQPARSGPQSRRALLITRGVFLVIALAGLGMIAGGVVSIHHKESGAEAKATIASCQQVFSAHATTYDCYGTWVEGGSLVGGNGHVIYGLVDDAEPSDIGKTLNVRVSGDHAYTPSLRVPIILLVLGGLLAIGSVVIAIAAGRQRPRDPVPTILSAAPTPANNE